MRSNSFDVVLTALFLLLVSSHLRAQAVDAQEHLKDLARANSLDAEGAQPWHLRMTFQLNDLYGKSKETGTIEEWWVSAKSRRLEIRSPSYNLTIPSEPSDPPASAARNRESYLVNQLLDEVVHPIPDYGDLKDLEVIEANRTFGKVTLSCISVARAKGSASPFTPPAQFCFAPGSTVLRGHLGEGQFAAVRNKMAKFRGIELGIDNGIAYGRNVAITGHIEALESLHPNSSIALSSTNSPTPSVIPGVVLAGHIIKKVTPEYPVFARQNHIAGSVILCATISKQGTISSLDVVSSPDPSLTASAMDAVKHWTYQPYLLNGEPTEVDTTITVNYNLN